jgi:hypothetical protein
MPASFSYSFVLPVFPHAHNYFRQDARGSAFVPWATMQRCPRVASKWSCMSASATPPVSATRMTPEEVLNVDQLAEMALVVDEVRALTPGIPLSGLRSALGLVKKAFGWGIASQGFWQGEVINDPPKLSKVRASLEFLRAEPLAFNDNEIEDILVLFPSVLNLDVSTMQANLEHLTKTWPVFKSEGKVRSTVLDKPNLLGFSIDCEGDCRALCTRCWIRF